MGQFYTFKKFNLDFNYTYFSHTYLVIYYCNLHILQIQRGWGENEDYKKINTCTLIVQDDFKIGHFESNDFSPFSSHPLCMLQYVHRLHQHNTYKYKPLNLTYINFSVLKKSWLCKLELKPLETYMEWSWEFGTHLQCQNTRVNFHVICWCNLPQYVTCCYNCINIIQLTKRVRCKKNKFIIESDLILKSFIVSKYQNGNKPNVILNCHRDQAHKHTKF